MGRTSVEVSLIWLSVFVRVRGAHGANWRVPGGGVASVAGRRVPRGGRDVPGGRAASGRGRQPILQGEVEHGVGRIVCYFPADLQEVRQDEVGSRLRGVRLQQHQAPTPASHT